MRPSLYLLAANAAASVFAYFYAMLAARSLGPDAFGIFSALLAIQVFLGVPAGGVGTAVLSLVARYQQRNQPAAALSVLLLPLGALAVAAGLVAGVLAVSGWIPAQFLHLESGGPLFLALAGTALTLGTGFLRGALLGRDDVKGVAVSVAFEATGRLAAGVLGLNAYSDLNAGLLFYYVGSLAGAASAVVSLHPMFRCLPSRISVSELLGLAARGVNAYVFVGIVTSVDVPLARHYLSPAESGAFAVSSSVAKVALLISASMVDPVLSRIAVADAGLYKRSAARVSASIIVACIPWVLLCWLLPGSVYSALFGPGYAAAVVTAGPLAVAATEAGLLYAMVKSAVVAGSRLPAKALASAAALQLAAIVAFHDSPLEIALAEVAAGGIGLALTHAALRRTSNSRVRSGVAVDLRPGESEAKDSGHLFSCRVSTSGIMPAKGRRTWSQTRRS